MRHSVNRKTSRSIEKADASYAVPEPIRGGGNGNTTRANWQREDLANHDPRTWSPCSGEEGNVEADEGNHGRDSCVVVFGFLACGNTNNADDELHNDHTGSSNDEELATAESLNRVERDWCRTSIHEGGNQGDQEGVLDRP